MLFLIMGLANFSLAGYNGSANAESKAADAALPRWREDYTANLWPDHILSDRKLLKEQCSPAPVVKNFESRSCGEIRVQLGSEF